MSSDGHEDPLARFLYALMNHELPIGTIERTIEHVRNVLKEVPESPAGRVALDAAGKLRTLVD